MNQETREFVAVVMSAELLHFCRINGLPFESACDLFGRDYLTDEQFGYLYAYIKIWDALID